MRTKHDFRSSKQSEQIFFLFFSPHHTGIRISVFKMESENNIARIGKEFSSFTLVRINPFSFMSPILFLFYRVTLLSSSQSFLDNRIIKIYFFFFFDKLSIK